MSAFPTALSLRLRRGPGTGEMLKCLLKHINIRYLSLNDKHLPQNRASHYREVLGARLI